MHQVFKKYEQAIESLYTYLHGNIGMTRMQLNRLSNNIIIRHFERKSMVIIPGEVDHYFNFIVKGAVRKYVPVGKRSLPYNYPLKGILSMLNYHFSPKHHQIVLLRLLSQQYFSL